MTEMTKTLPVRLTEEEIALRSRMLAGAVKDREAVKLEAKASATEFKERLAEIESKITDAAEAVHTGKEHRLVVVYERIDARRFQIDIIRTDSGDIVESRAMTKEEIDDASQTKMFDGSKTRVAVPAESPEPVQKSNDDASKLGRHDAPVTSFSFIEANEADTLALEPSSPVSEQPVIVSEGIAGGEVPCEDCATLGGHDIDCPRLAVPVPPIEAVTVPPQETIPVRPSLGGMMTIASSPKRERKPRGLKSSATDAADAAVDLPPIPPIPAMEPMAPMAPMAPMLEDDTVPF